MRFTWPPNSPTVVTCWSLDGGNAKDINLFWGVEHVWDHGHVKLWFPVTADASTMDDLFHDRKGTELVNIWMY